MQPFSLKKIKKSMQPFSLKEIKNLCSLQVRVGSSYITSQWSKTVYYNIIIIIIVISFFFFFEIKDRIILKNQKYLYTWGLEKEQAKRVSRL